MKLNKNMRFLFLVVFAISLSFNCTLFTSEEHKVFNVIRKGEKALEKENLSAIQQIVSKDYQDDWGHDYDGLIQWFSVYCKQYKNIKINFSKNEITVNQNLAICKISVYISGYDYYNDELIVDQTELLIYLEKINGIWLIISANKISLQSEL